MSRLPWDQSLTAYYELELARRRALRHVGRSTTPAELLDATLRLLRLCAADQYTLVACLWDLIALFTHLVTDTETTNFRLAESSRTLARGVIELAFRRATGAIDGFYRRAPADPSLREALLIERVAELEGRLAALETHVRVASEPFADDNASSQDEETPFRDHLY